MVAETWDGYLNDINGPHVRPEHAVADAPLLPGQCEGLARRVPIGLGRTGTTGGHFSGDIFLALSTANAGSLASTEMTGRDGHRPPALPHDRVRELLAGHPDVLGTV
ncbi:P1 family peptidase [Streptomyces sp. NPDC003660]